MEKNHMELMTSEEVMIELKISRSTLDKLLETGQLTAKRIGENGSLRFERESVQAVLQPRTAPVTRQTIGRGAISGRGMKRRRGQKQSPLPAKTPTGDMIC